MAEKGKKKAKLAHEKKRAADGEVASRLVMVCDSLADEDRRLLLTHRITRNVTGRTDCGLLVGDPKVRDPRWSTTGVTGWRYGAKDDVNCPACTGVLHFTPTEEG